MDLERFSPNPTFINWKGAAIKLRPFDLRAITWAERFFCGFDKMNANLSNDNDLNLVNNTLIDIVYHLGSDDFKKHGISNSLGLKLAITETGREALDLEYAIQAAIMYKLTLSDKHKIKLIDEKIAKVKKISEELSNETTVEILIEFRSAVQQSLLDSFPKKVDEAEYSGGAIFQFLMQKGEKEAAKETNWPEIYAKFFAVGGMTIEQFYSLTMRQVDILSEEINLLKFEDFRSDATIHGINPKKITGPKRKLRAI